MVVEPTLVLIYIYIYVCVCSLSLSRVCECLPPLLVFLSETKRKALDERPGHRILAPEGGEALTWGGWGSPAKLCNSVVGSFLLLLQQDVS